MARSASVIEINGNRYDAMTGQVIGAAKRVAAQVKNPSGVVDGLVRRPAVSLASSIKTGGSDPNDKASLRQRYKISNVRRQTQHSQTLMRTAVKKPKMADKSEAASPIQKSRLGLNPIRASRAKTIDKNNKVAHFNLSASSKRTNKPVNISKAPNSTQKSLNLATTASPQTTAAPLPSMISSASHQYLEKLLDHALLQADAHKQAQKRNKSLFKFINLPRWASAGAVSLAVLLLAGFYAWQNIPQVSMRVAASRAHVNASVPGYVPAGYSPSGPASISAGQITLAYNSTYGNYNLSEEASNWDSTSVAANEVPTGTQVQSSQVNGTTVYIYGQDNDATWVNHGVLFKIQDQANLSSDQILKIAQSL